MEKYDDASWHFDGDYPNELPRENAATHIGFYFTWIVDNNMASDEIIESFPNYIKKIKTRHMTGAQFIINDCDEKITTDHLTNLGNAFTRDYYNEDTDFSLNQSSYFKDYSKIFCHKPIYKTIYHIEDTFENYNLIRKIINKRFLIWQSRLSRL